MAFVVHQWRANRTHVQTLFFLRQDIPLPARQALERGQFADAAAYVPPEVLRAAQTTTAPIRWVFRMIAPDDRADIACKKVLYEILGRRKLTSSDGMAAWRKDGPVLFKFDEVSLLPANPFDAPTSGANSNPNRVPRDHEWIGTAPMNVALAEDLHPSLHAVYLWSIASIKTPLQQDAWMAAFYRESLSGQQLYDEGDVKFIDCAWSGVAPSISLERAFAKLHTSARAPLIQWLDDRHHILYKLEKKHKLPATQLETLTKYERIPLTGPSYVSATLLDRQSPSINSKLMLTSSGGVELRLRPNITGIAAFKAYEKQQVTSAREWLGSVVKTREWALTGATVRTVFSCPSGLQLPALVEALSKYTSFINVKRMASGSKYLLQWLRASNYKANVDISNVINARLRLGVDTDTILNDLVDVNGLPMAEARGLLDGVIMTLENPDNVNVKEQRNVAVAIGLTVILNNHPKGVEMTIRDASSYQDIRMTLFWLQGMFKVVFEDLKKGGPVPAPASPAPARASPTKEKEEAHPDSLEADPFALSASSSSSSSSQYGGSENFIIDLQKADPQLFANNYSKRCQSASNSQPVVMTQAEFAALDAKYKRTLTSHMVYGSSSDTRTHHVYFCPTVWCSDSRTPMSYEQYIENGSKCPDGKAGIKLWEEDNKKRKLANIGFYGKSIEGAEPCLPCCYSRALNELNKGKCMKKVVGSPPEEKSTATETAAAANAKDYILTHSSPLPKDRWGTLPRSLHMVLHPSSLLQTQCTQQVTTKPCLLRRGILHHSDSFMQALGFLFTGQTNAKGALLRMMREVITPEVFITLENGLVLAAFAIEDAGIIPTAANCAKWVTWMGTPECKKYKAMFGLTGLVRAAKEGGGLNQADGLRISRELAIHKAFVRFHTYLASTEPKDASLLVDAVRHLGVHLVLWEKDAADTSLVRMRCPAVVPYSALSTSSSSLTPLVGMLLQEKGVFEPIELGSKSTFQEHTTLHSPTAALKKMMNECDANIVHGAPATHAWVETVRAIDAAARLVLEDPARYVWRKIVVSPDYAIVGLTNIGAGFVQCGRVPIGGLLDLIEVLPHLQVVYQEDATYYPRGEINPDDEDAVLFDTLLKTFGADGAQAAAVALAPSIILKRLQDDLKKVENGEREDNAAWRSTKWLVGRELMKHYDTRVAPFLKANATREAFVTANIDAFPAAAKYIEEALYEVAGSLKHNHIEEWMSSTDRDAWPFLSTNIIARGKHEWVFSQLAVERGLPTHVIKPVDGARPRTYVRREDDAGFLETWPNRVVRVPEPSNSSGTAEHAKLPWKWEAARKYTWREWDIVLQTLQKTNNKYICKWIEWAVAERGIPFKWSMVTFALKVYVTKVVAPDDDALNSYVKQSGMLALVKRIVQGGLPALLAMSLDDRRRVLLQTVGQVGQVGAGDGDLVTDIAMELAARWTGVTILIVANVDYVKADRDSPVLCADYKPTVDREEDLVMCADGPKVTAHARGSPKDLITNAVLMYNEELSTTREAVWKRPFIMLYKDVAKGNASARYAPVGQGVWASLRHCPKDLQHVVCCLWKHKNKN